MRQASTEKLVVDFQFYWTFNKSVTTSYLKKQPANHHEL